jgi:hypothetical protein
LSGRSHGFLPETNTGGRGFTHLAFRKLELCARHITDLGVTCSCRFLACVICRVDKTLSS